MIILGVGGKCKYNLGILIKVYKKSSNTFFNGGWILISKI